MSTDTSYTSFKGELEKSLETLYDTNIHNIENPTGKAFNIEDIFRFFYGDNNLLTYIKTGNSEPIINKFDEKVATHEKITKDVQKNLGHLKNGLKEIINKITINGDKVKISQNSFKQEQMLKKLQEETANFNQNETAKNAQAAIRAKLEAPKIDQTTVIGFIASAIFVRRLAFLYAYCTVAVKLAEMIPPYQVPPGGNQNVDVNNIINNHIDKLEISQCQDLLKGAVSQVSNLREIIRNLLLFHNEDVNLGMHYDLVAPAAPGVQGRAG